MSKDNRIVTLGWIAMVVLTISFVFSLVTAIIGKIEMSILGAIAYAVSIILFEYCLYGEPNRGRRRFVSLLLLEALQLVPYLLILVIRSLIV